MTPVSQNDDEVKEELVRGGNYPCLYYSEKM